MRTGPSYVPRLKDSWFQVVAVYPGTAGLVEIDFIAQFPNAERLASFMNIHGALRMEMAG